MMGRTHAVGGALAGLTVSCAAGLGIEEATAVTLGATATSKLPDVDARLIRSPDHRSFPHSLVFGGGGAMLFALILTGLTSSGAASGWLSGLGGIVSPGTQSLVLLGAVVGYFAHLALDASTKSGIWLLMPSGRRLGLPKRYSIRTGSPIELVIFGIMAISCPALGLWIFAPALDGSQLSFDVTSGLYAFGGE